MKKILIVDDAPTVIKLVQFSLEDDYDVDSAASGEEALEKLKSNTYDLGIFDINMPGINGIELTRRAKAMDSGKDMKIIILTTETAEDLQKEGKDAGALGWLNKPFEEQDLIKMLSAIFGT